MREGAPDIVAPISEQASPQAQASFESENISQTIPASEHVNPRQTLEDFVLRPFTSAEISSKQDYNKLVPTWFSRALRDAGYPSDQVDSLIKNSLDKINFTQSAEKFVDDINRIIRNFHKAAPKQPKQSGEVIIKTDGEVVQDIVSVTSPDPSVRPLPAVSLEKNATVSEKVSAAETRSQYRTTLENLNNQPFNRHDYLDYAFDVHTGLRACYDAVLDKARKNLKRYSSVNASSQDMYVPSQTEKLALQSLSRLQGQYAKMQKAESEIGIVRAELVNSLNRTDEFTSETEVKNSAEKYVEEVEKLLVNITNLENLIEIAKTEEKPPVAEAYRTQLEKIRIEGNQVLATVDVNHPLYKQFKSTVTEDLADLTDFASIDKDGDRAVMEGLDVFLLRRDRIKAAILYMKTEHEVSDFYTRVQKRINDISSRIQNITPDTEERRHTKDSLQGNLNDLQTLLGNKNEISRDQAEHFITTDVFVEHTKSLKDQKIEIQNLLGGAQVLSTEFGNSPEMSEEVEVMKPQPYILKNPEVPVGKVFVLAQTRLHKVQQSLKESALVLERVESITSRLRLPQVGRMAALIASKELAPSPTGEVNAADSNQFPNILIASQPNQVLNTFTPDFNSIFDYLRTAPKAINLSTTPANATIKANKIQMPPVLKNKLITEIVPGVEFNTDETSLETSEATTTGFSALADTVPADDGIILNNPQEETPDKIYKINIGDRFWDINEGETLAGKLPVMSQINSYFKNALIDRARDRLNADAQLRLKIGGIGDTADVLIPDAEMNLTELNNLLVQIAIEYGYLSYQN